MDTSEELRSVVAQALESKGVLAKLRAQLRREVFQVLDEQEHGGASPPAAALEKLNAFKATPEGASLLSLIAEFFDFFELEYTLSIFQAEAKLDSRFHGRRAVAESLGMSNAQATQPLLAEVYEGWSQGGGVRSNTVSDHGASSPEPTLPPPPARDRKAFSEDASGGSRSASSHSGISATDFGSGSTRGTQGSRRSARVSMDDEIEALMSGGSMATAAATQGSSTDSASPPATSSSRPSASALAPLPTSKPPSKLGPLAPLGKPKLSELPPLSRSSQQHEEAEAEVDDVLATSGDDRARLQEVEGRMKQLKEAGKGDTAAASTLQAPAFASAEASGEYEYADDFGQDGVQEEIDIEPETGESDYRFQASTSADGVDVGRQPSGFVDDARAPSGFRSTNFDYYEEMEHL